MWRRCAALPESRRSRFIPTMPPRAASRAARWCPSETTAAGSARRLSLPTACVPASSPPPPSGGGKLRQTGATPITQPPKPSPTSGVAPPFTTTSSRFDQLNSPPYDLRSEHRLHFPRLAGDRSSQREDQPPQLRPL